VSKSLLQVAKDMDAVSIVELARSKCDLKGGYTGLNLVYLFKLFK
jgi:hypothetical protein